MRERKICGRNLVFFCFGFVTDSYQSCDECAAIRRDGELRDEASAMAVSPVSAAAQNGAARRVGVLLVNLGTPEAPTADSVRRYLAEFLADRRVVDYPRAIWLPILHGVILNARPARSARAYAKIWTAEGSPLRVHTQRAAEKLQARLGEAAATAWAMRYGRPSIGEAAAALKDVGVERLLALPLYPQYAQATSASAADAVFDAVRSLVPQPALRLAGPFHDDPLYIAALKRRCDAHLGALGWAPERIILSFHGAPKRLIAAGDPYYAHCVATARLIRAEMGWTDSFAPLAFQSKFGREEWLGPATDAMISDFAAAGVRRLAVMTPGFFADCLETLEEIGIAGADAFAAAGGERFAAIPCLNDSPAAIDLLAALVAREAAGWL
jgi:ferrochelatase